MAETADSPIPGPFELSGGALCLDFANTWADRGRPETDQLGTYGDLLAFARQTGLVSAREGGRLAARAARERQASQSALARARQLREALYRIFSCRARGRAIAPGDVEQVNGALREALPHLRLEAGDGELAWRWSPDSVSLFTPLWPIVRSAAELLTSADLARVRECDGARCTWLFLDRSRSRSRRWCSMASCGNRAKARRHYQRQRTE